MSKGKVVFASLIILAVFCLTFYLLEPAVSPLQVSNKVNSRGAIKAVGVGVYSDSSCSSRLSSIDWGILEPGANKNLPCYIRNEEKSAVTLSLSTANWSPSNASQHMTLTWDYAGKSISPSEVIKVTFKLAVSANIAGIKDFSFDVIILGTG